MITWKTQRFDKTSLISCVAMLIGEHGIQVEDRDIIPGSGMPYRLEFRPEDAGLCGGIMSQEPAMFNRFLAPYGLELQEIATATADALMNILDSQISKGAVCASFRKTCLPSEVYQSIDMPPGNHHVVVVSAPDGGYECYDPDGCLDRFHDYRFEDVKDQVVFHLERNQVITALESDEKGLFRGYHLSRGPAMPLLTHADIITASVAALGQFRDFTKSAESRLQSEQDRYECTIGLAKAWITPLAIDLRIAIQAMPDQGPAQEKAIRVLTRLEDIVVAHQRYLIVKGDEKDGFFRQLEQLGETVSEVLTAHITSWKE